MENSLNNMNKLSLNKDVFKQKGGTLGLVILAAVVVLIAFNLPAIVAWVDSLARLVVTLAFLAGFLYVLFDPKARLILSTGYMLVIKKILAAFVKMDPISILEASIAKMYRSIAKLEDSMGKLNGVRLKLADKISEKKGELQDCFDRIKAAGKKGSPIEKLKEERQSTRINDLIVEYIKLHDSAEKWYSSMSKIAEMAKFTVEDAENEVANQKEKYTMVKQAHSAFKSAMSVINGNPDDLALYNEAWSFTQEDIMSKLGEMDRVINTAGGLMDKIDVDKEVFQIKGDDLLSKYEELGMDGLFQKFESTDKKAFPVADMISSGDNALTKSSHKYFN
jgi:hypothetical protein